MYITHSHTLRLCQLSVILIAYYRVLDVLQQADGGVTSKNHDALDIARHYLPEVAENRYCIVLHSIATTVTSDSELVE